MDSLMKSLSVAPRWIKRRVLVLLDGLIVAASLQLATMIHLESFQPLRDGSLWMTIGLLVPTSLLLFHWLGLYRIVIRYMSHVTVPTVALVVATSALLVVPVSYMVEHPVGLSVIVIYTLLLLLGIGSLRFLIRELYRYSQRRQRKPVVIYGAGAAGCELVDALRHGGEYEPVAFVDDWRGLEGAMVEGLRVHQPVALAALVQEYQAAMVLLAIPSAPRWRRREILHWLSGLSVPLKTIPGSADVIAGRAKISELHDVALEDLLGREAVPAFPELLQANIRDKSVMVTGAGGSIGSELCRQILAQNPIRLLLVDNCEFALYAIEQELRQVVETNHSRCELKPLLISVQHAGGLKAVFDSFQVHTVYHAAAYKHVPMVEFNLVQGISNNVFGTLNLAQAAMTAGVEAFVVISTDKAVRPTNAMGASKRLTELICQAFANAQSKTRFCMVRFGNVLGSSGSVVPLFRKQIEQGGPINVTHPEITRYFMTIPEAAQLVIQAGAMGEGGEVFVLDMGEPVRILDLAVNMVRLSGLEVRDAEHPEGDIEIVYSGLRPGEKLYEELLIGDDVRRTRHDRIMTSKERFWEWPRLETFLNELEQAFIEADHVHIRQLLQSAPLDYHPLDEIADLVWTARQTSPREPQSQRLNTNPFLTSSTRHDSALNQVLNPVTKES
ncbi:polysaccharide biosynthesis protein [Vreelandella venusta]|uniref:Nucleoside-diphosphate sugar epimerase n=2 Tax=Vreelandella venusta TaxID=44935 RepID=A0ABX2B8Y9_9GAMM|nr:nucleoside-diphosphate sugar epimerase/dehydratase [Halomonas venusta]MBR9923445.1 polysaccharide biosynthesis protein [Gammaproteobacteria bacterium]AZM96130.1 polysaccharide biosynthesis protein [Halomonas venusta]MDW0358025.1 nucleoside-diphosphate sugar epimerase/dehydratase [Halomonas venusta]NPT30575.1 nucleoside-diphosphate sugar epimerase [Halomonas venusta]WAM47036.1 polysaccharide biosynthesis protein [Halomonas venusta]